MVLGGSMAGLLAARVLADHFERVTILERDHYPNGPLPRKGVPQARHLHVMLLRGRQLLERFFPGFGGEMAAAGVPQFDVAQDFAWLTPAGWGVRFRSGLDMITFTRDLLDWVVRRRVAAWPGVTIREGADITGLTMDASGQGVAGVTVRWRGPEAAAAEETLSADLVVDASGRGSRLTQWLDMVGYAKPPEMVINAHLGYASRLYRLTRPLPDGFQGVMVQAAPPVRNRAGIVLPIENGAAMVTVAGGGGDYPPTEEADFLEFARSLDSPMIYEAIKDAVPLSPIHGYKGTGNRQRHYERLARWPERLVALGDAVCAFNPVYGQGMTTAALGAERLGQLLSQWRSRGNLTGLGRRFQKDLARINAAPWMMATGEDLYYPGADGGQRTAGSEMVHWYMNQVMGLSTESPTIRRRFLEVFHMLERPESLFRLAVLRRALWRGLTHRTSHPKTELSRRTGSPRFDESRQASSAAQ